jgi:hypothetical protein
MHLWGVTCGGRNGYTAGAMARSLSGDGDSIAMLLESMVKLMCPDKRLDLKARAVGSVVRASVSHTEGHRFKSCTAHHRIAGKGNGIRR